MIRDIYIELFHGRTDPEKCMDDWGTEGPILGPFGFCHITYFSGDLKIGDDMTLSGYKDMVYYDRVFYGDFSILSGRSILDDLVLRKRIKKFNPARTILPKIYDPSLKQYEVEVSRNYTHTGSTLVWAKNSLDAHKLAKDEIDDIELKLGQLVEGTDDILYVEEVK